MRRKAVAADDLQLGGVGEFEGVVTERLLNRILVGALGNGCGGVARIVLVKERNARW